MLGATRGQPLRLDHHVDRAALGVAGQGQEAVLGGGRWRCRRASVAAHGAPVGRAEPAGIDLTTRWAGEEALSQFVGGELLEVPAELWVGSLDVGPGDRPGQSVLQVTD